MPGAGSTYRDPDFSFLEQIGPTGLAFPYRSQLGPAYDRVLLVASFNLPGRIHALPLDGARKSFDPSRFPALADGVADDMAEADLLLLASGFSHPVDLEMAPDGSLFVLSWIPGTIYRMTGPGRPPIPALGAQRTRAIAPLLLALILVGVAGLAARPRRVRRSAR